MEWSRSSITAEEMERRQREYIEAAMNMAKKASFSTPVQALPPEPVQNEQEAANEPAEPVQNEQEAANEPAEPVKTEQEQPVQKEERDEEKTTFGVFDKEELKTAAENGTVSGEGLKRAAEILEEMSEKTEEMRRVYGQSDVREKPSSQPQSLGGYVNRHNGGSCPRCGQAYNGSRL